MNTLRAIKTAAAPLALVALLSACGAAEEEAAAPEATEAAAPEAAALEMDAEGVPVVLEERHENFEGIGDAFKAIREQLEGSAPDLAVIGENAQDINTRAQLIKTHFPAGTGKGAGYDTEALDTIWEKPDEFAAAHENLVAKSAALVTAANGGDAAAVGEAVKEMGGACKQCHDTFREKKE